ncbi:hypothetical protein K9U39_18180 [Rhodoblastus acidophilus]|uniref:Transcriptional regulator n=1 Tax=Candidatus Rhodoblastus alkanivorans TaxID=2954117 RepID=A0ABS9Z2F4_9HYPH|nr:hypothetical protein [Candidatus Rhodoblastus alkanivorans]MCI4677429.1 hypothetical protein [Candidatus Rhodoblastus alkanivorans]MCI4681788.1 hypothetical protein [Candidatus Rhodoblastus alkanivorans]MDI4642838.1 hypothetical protein [Rhodoblastus acidophilus]
MIGEGVCEVTAEGESFFAELGIDVRAQARQRRALCRSCLDVTERRPHIGGAVGAALAQRLLEQKLPQPIDDSRGLAVTAAGRWRLRKIFGPGLFAD